MRGSEAEDMEVEESKKISISFMWLLVCISETGPKSLLFIGGLGFFIGGGNPLEGGIPFRIDF
jgi:hypothetical protein